MNLVKLAVPFDTLFWRASASCSLTKNANDVILRFVFVAASAVFAAVLPLSLARPFPSVTAVADFVADLAVAARVFVAAFESFEAADRLRLRLLDGLASMAAVEPDGRLRDVFAGCPAAERPFEAAPFPRPPPLLDVEAARPF